MSKLRIAVIGAKGFPAYGGAARSSEEVFCRLANTHDVTVYAMKSHASQKKYLNMRQIIMPLQLPKIPKAILYLILSAFHAVLFCKYDVIHVNHLSSCFILPILRLRYPVLLNVHGLDSHYDDKWRPAHRRMVRAYVTPLASLANVIVSVQKSSLGYLGGISSDVVYIPNGVSKYNRKAFLKTFEYDICFSAARIIRLKGLHILFKSLNILNYPGKIVVIGDVNQLSDYKSELLAMSESLNVEYTGIISSKEELFNCIQSSRLFVFPSFSEGMSNMLLEVAALEVPIIASDIVQNTDIFSTHEISYFKSGDVEDLAFSIEKCFRNYDEALVKAKRAHDYVIENYNWDSISRDYEVNLLKIAKSFGDSYQ